VVSDADRRREGEVAEKARPKTDQPKLYKVLLHNDDYTTMEFVIAILESVFAKSPSEAFRVMMLVHTQGIGIAGVYPFEVAETKVVMVDERAREAGHPLRCSLEPD
jgi:ATP-dependent Clp protease adaptor protein ClpS